MAAEAVVAGARGFKAPAVWGWEMVATPGARKCAAELVVVAEMPPL